MEYVRVFLRTPLFTTRGDGHVPPATFVVEGQVRDLSSGGMVLDAVRYFNDAGLELDGQPRALFLPVAKIDHVLLREDKTEAS